jgi:hypothetical protein
MCFSNLYLKSHIMYHTIRTKVSFFDNCDPLECLNSRNTVNSEQVRSWKFQVKDLLLYIADYLVCYLTG